MKHEDFFKGKEILDKIQDLNTYKNRLFWIRDNKSLVVVLKYESGSEIKQQLFKNNDLINEAIGKEIVIVTEKLIELQKQFDEL